MAAPKILEFDPEGNLHNAWGRPITTRVGRPGRMAGQFHWLDGIAMDSLGNIYTGEVDDGKRVQKFVLLNGDGVRGFRPHD